MRERLWEVAEVLPRRRVHLFAIEPERAAQDAKVIEQVTGFVGTPDPGECSHQPERAGQEGAFAPRRPSVPGG